MSVFHAYQSAPWLFVTGAVLLGLVVGSFLNVVIHRLPLMLMREWRLQAAEIAIEWAADKEAPAEARAMSETLARMQEESRKRSRYNLVVPRSGCVSCGHQIGALENVPVLSWLWLKGKCSHCNAPISARYPLVEALTGALSGYFAWRFGAHPLALVAGLAFLWAMIALAFIDLDTTYLPDDITQPLLWGGLLVSLAGVFTDVQSSLLGAVFGYLTFWVVAKAWTLLRGVESMGHGDFKLLAAIGAWLGWEMLPQAVLVSSMLGASVGGVLMLAGRGDLSTKIPFGPYLAIAGIVAMLHGRQINEYYIQLLQL